LGYENCQLVVAQMHWITIWQMFMKYNLKSYKVFTYRHRKFPCLCKNLNYSITFHIAQWACRRPVQSRLASTSRIDMRRCRSLRIRSASRAETISGTAGSWNRSAIFSSRNAVISIVVNRTMIHPAYKLLVLISVLASDVPGGAVTAVNAALAIL
jgi:hypothetical protein